MNKSIYTLSINKYCNNLFRNKKKKKKTVHFDFRFILFLQEKSVHW